jgi:hypothetical protein
MMFESKATNIYLPQRAEFEFTTPLISGELQKGSKGVNSTAVAKPDEDETEE